MTARLGNDHLLPAARAACRASCLNDDCKRTGRCDRLPSPQEFNEVRAALVAFLENPPQSVLDMLANTSAAYLLFGTAAAKVDFRAIAAALKESGS